MEENSSCKKFVYSPLKRIPVKQLNIEGAITAEEMYVEISEEELAAKQAAAAKADAAEKAHADKVKANQEAEAKAKAEAEAKAKAEAEAKAKAEAEAKAKAEAQERARQEAAAAATNVSNDVASLQSYAHNLVLSYGWSEADFTALVSLWNRESGWNVHAGNSSGAYGIPQALPGSKMAAFGSDWANNGQTQIKWGLSYIKSTYGSPSAAWSAFCTKGWY